MRLVLAHWLNVIQIWWLSLALPLLSSVIINAVKLLITSIICVIKKIGKGFSILYEDFAPKNIYTFMFMFI